MEQIRDAMFADDGGALTQLIASHPGLKPQIDDPLFPFDQPAIVFAAGKGRRRIVDALLSAGANINVRSHWWAGGFGVLDSTGPELAAYLIERGAIVDAHSAARLGMFDKLKAFVSADPEVVHARGGDGQTPLHFAGAVEIAEFLLDSGADIDARDIDHESTAAQYLVQSHPEVVRCLIRRGAKTDILMAAAIGGNDLVRKHLDADPECIRMRVNEQFFPKQNPHSGGTIYTWTLGANRSPHQVASKFGHTEALGILMDRSPTDVRLINACLLGDEPTVIALLENHPELMQALPDTDRRQISSAAEDNNTDAVRLMLTCGWPVDGGGQGPSPLHWAAWHGNAEMVRVILEHNPPLEVSNDATFGAPPMGWAVHGSEHSWHCKTGDYAGAIRALLAAGAKRPDTIEGSAAARAALA
ncbi:MAG TPA: ankyrin repeat domain-containing protein [Bryobacteraceae bacterium]